MTTFKWSKNLPAIQDCGDDNSSVHLAMIRDARGGFAKLKLLDSPPKELLVFNFRLSRSL